jgi:hypothetical protein
MSEDNAMYCCGSAAEYRYAYHQSGMTNDNAAYPYGGEAKDNTA